MCSDKAIDKTLFFLVNQLALTCIKSKFSLARLWKQGVQYLDVCESPTCCTSQGDDVVEHSMTMFAIVSLFSKVTTDGCPKHGKFSSVSWFSNFDVKRL